MTSKAEQAQDEIVRRVLQKDKRGAILEAEQELDDILERFGVAIGDRVTFDVCATSLLSKLYDRVLESVSDIAELRGF